MELAGALQSSTQITYSRAPPPVPMCADNCLDPLDPNPRLVRLPREPWLMLMKALRAMSEQGR